MAASRSMDRLSVCARSISRPRALLAAIFVGAMVAGAVAVRPWTADRSAALPLAPTAFTTGEFLVRFRPGTSADLVRSVHAQNHTQVLQELSGIGVQRIRVASGWSVGEMVRVYLLNPNVEYAEPNYLRTATNDPNDLYYAKQWNAAKIGMSGAWDVTQGSASVRIAVLDSGIATTHEDLVGRYGSPADVDDNGHGTYVAGIAGAATGNAKGVAGICQLCTLASYKVLNSTGSGSDSALAAAIVAAADAGARVINMSLGGYATSSTVQDAVNYAWNKGVVLVAAAGNDATSAQFYPAAYPNVIAVGGSDANDARVSTSNYGPWVRAYAPGQSILTTSISGSYALTSGTSVAAPHVAGLAGLILSAAPALTNQQVVSLILGNTDSTPAGPRINACRAVAAAAGRTCGATASTATATPASATPTMITSSTAAPSASIVAALATGTPSATATPTPTAAPSSTSSPSWAPTSSPIATTVASATPSPTSAPKSHGNPRGH